MAVGGTDCGNDAFADPGDDGLFAGSANQMFDVGTHGNSRLDPEFDAVLGNGGHRRRFNHFGQNAHLYGLENVAARQVDGAGCFKGKTDARLLCADQRVDNPFHIALCQVMGLQHVGVHFQVRLAALDIRVNDLLGRNPAKTHAHQGRNLHRYAAGHRGNPESQGNVTEEDQKRDQDDRGHQYQCDVANSHNDTSFSIQSQLS